MVKNIILISHFFLFSGLCSIDAQHYFTKKEGLVDNNVQCIYKDSYGFMWFGTSNGLSRFDGYEFVNYNQESESDLQLSDNTIFDIVEDKNQNLWIATSYGLNKYIRQENRMVSYTKENIINTGFTNYAILDLQIEDQYLYMATWDGVSIWNLENDSLENFTLNINDNWDSSGVAIAVLDTNIYYGSFGSGLFKLHLKTRKFTPVQFNFSEIMQGKRTRVLSLQALSKDTLLIAISDHGLHFLDCKNNPLKALPVKTNKKLGSINSISNNGTTLYLSSTHDVFKGHLINNGKIENIEQIWSYDETKVIINSCISSDEMLWLGFWDNGLVALPVNNQHIYNYPTETLDLQEKRVYYSYENYEDQVFLFSFENKNGIIYDFNSQKNYIPFYNNRISLLGLSYRNIIQTINRDYWVIRKNLITRYQNKDGAILNYTPKDLMEYREAYFFEDNKKTLYLLTTSQLYQFEPAENEFILIKNIDYSHNSTPSIFSFDETYNRLWFRSHFQFGYFDFDTQSSKIFSNKPSRVFPKISGLNAFCSLSDTSVYIGFNSGLYKLTFNHNNYQLIKVNFITNAVSGILSDKRKNLWVATNNGLSVLDSSENHLFTLYDNHGPGVSMYDKYTWIKRKNGQLIFGAENAFVVIDPEKYVDTRNKSFAPLLFTDINITGTHKEDIYRTIGSDYTVNSLSLPSRFKNISLTFASLDYFQPDKVQYAYRFKELDADWTEHGNKRNLTFSHLSPGEYFLEIRASNSFHEWNTSSSILTIEIQPPWYKTTWFRLLLGIFTLAIFYLFYLIRVKSIHRYNRKLEQEIQKRTHEIENQKTDLETAANTIHSSNIELKKLNATKDKFFSIIAHDLKNPFMGILGITELLQSKFDTIDDIKKQEHIQHLNQSAQSAHTLLENLLNWSYSQTNLIKNEPELFNLSSLVKEVFHLLQLNAEKKKIHLDYKISETLMVFADKNMITTVIRNLISNAIKFTSEKGKIDLTAEAKEAFVEIVIADNGVGMNEHQKNELFEIANQNTTPGTSGETGTGLGLILCKEFIDKNKGTIEVQSEKNKGSIFTIRLPLNNREPIVEAPLKVSEENEPRIIDPDNDLINSIDEEQFKNNVVLIVEDTIEIRDVLVQSLEQNYQLLLAKNGKEGVEIALNEIPDIIISDIMMPEMDGFELTEKLKKDERTSHIPLILLTARDSDASHIKGLETGADDYLIKPFNPELLKTRIKSVLLSRRRLREKFTMDILSEPRDVTITNTDEQFLHKAISIVEDNISNTEFSVDYFVEKMNMSRTQLYRKMNQITGHPVNEFFRITRLKQSARLLLIPDMKISDVAYKVGFNDLQSFSRAFKNQFGMSPRSWIKDNTSKDQSN